MRRKISAIEKALFAVTFGGLGLLTVGAGLVHYSNQKDTTKVSSDFYYNLGNVVACVGTVIGYAGVALLDSEREETNLKELLL